MFIALALINDPEVVFLNELTTGLDPQARRAIWELVRGIRQRGKTVFLTTHLMEEAERLCDRLAIIDHGRIVDIGTPANSYDATARSAPVIVVTDDPGALERFRAIRGVTSVSREGSDVTIRGEDHNLVAQVIDCLAECRIHVADFRTVLPTLEDVFLELTGHTIRH